MPKKLAVVGAGLMGSGIAQVAAQSGWQVLLRDLTDDALARGRSAIESSYRRFAAKGQLTDDEVDASLARIRTTTQLDAVADADLVVEAVFESVEVKREVFEALGKLCRDDAVLASNTSAIPITQLAAATSRPESVVGTHFFSPVPMMPLCELVRGHKTSDETLARAREFAEDAARLVESGVATAEDVDTACRLGFGHRMGPLQTMDLTGIDVLVHAARNIYTDTADDKFFPPESLLRMVAAGDLGRKTGRGYYHYPKD